MFEFITSESVFSEGIAVAIRNQQQKVQIPVKKYFKNEFLFKKLRKGKNYKSKKLYSDSTNLLTVFMDFRDIYRLCLLMCNKMLITSNYSYVMRCNKNYYLKNVKNKYCKMRNTSILKFLKRKSCIYYNTKSISTYLCYLEPFYESIQDKIAERIF